MYVLTFGIMRAGGKWSAKRVISAPETKRGFKIGAYIKGSARETLVEAVKARNERMRADGMEIEDVDYTEEELLADRNMPGGVKRPPISIPQKAPEPDTDGEFDPTPYNMLTKEAIDNLIANRLDGKPRPPGGVRAEAAEVARAFKFMGIDRSDMVGATKWIMESDCFEVRRGLLKYMETERVGFPTIKNVSNAMVELSRIIHRKPRGDIQRTHEYFVIKKENKPPKVPAKPVPTWDTILPKLSALARKGPAEKALASLVKSRPLRTSEYLQLCTNKPSKCTILKDRIFLPATKNRDPKRFIPYPKDVRIYVNSVVLKRGGGRFFEWTQDQLQKLLLEATGVGNTVLRQSFASYPSNVDRIDIPELASSMGHSLRCHVADYIVQTGIPEPIDDPEESIDNPEADPEDDIAKLERLRAEVKALEAKIPSKKKKFPLNLFW